MPADIIDATPGAGDHFVWREITADTGEVKWHPFSAFWNGLSPD
ncbi:hypothetical protein HNQ07_000240 [Deinococcus metalli]|uniref:Uncharacterized protein n=1 Tax=Deinococcus metalli TaxID=1141878 RepID=A0A7W8NMK7_9DEIO|nr:hypothetical protein [Deinococcus metalli]MBB5374796.1 hypothetical protein [Deinococcus metalli]